MNRQQILIACHDASLRLESFDRVGALGFRIDAVGDDRGLSRRLAKDTYALLVHDRLLTPQPEHRGATLLVDAELLADGETFEDGVKNLMAADRER